MTFAAPQNAWFLLMPAGIVLLYLLRRRYQPRQVPSTFLWKAALRDPAASRPIQRLRKNILLPVQFLASLLLALALMQPNLTVDKASRTVFIFDLSGSMQAVSSGKSRLDEAKDRAEEMLRGLPPGEEVTVLSAGSEVRQALSGSTDREDTAAAFRALTCGRGGADLGRAVSLAEAIRREDPDRGARIVVFSDSYVPPAGITAVNVGAGEDNRCISSLTTEEGTAYARVSNFGADCTLTVRCAADGTLCDVKEITLAAGETAGVFFTLPEGAALAEVSIREADALNADNRAEAAVFRNPVRTVALSGDNLFLESALLSRNDIRVIRVQEDAPAETEADLYIYGTSPVIFSRDPSRTAFTFPEEDQEPEGSLTAEESPLTEGLTLRNVTLRSCRPLAGGRAAIRSGDQVLAAWTESEAAFGFRLQDTNLPLKYDFPVLIQNILNHLLPPVSADLPETLPPMDPAESDVRRVAGNAEGEGARNAAARGRDLTGFLAGAFLVLLTLEFILAREPWARSGRAPKPGTGKKHPRSKKERGTAS